MKVNVSLRIKWKEFCENTSIHGLIYIYAKPYLSKATRLFWKIIWLTFFALCIYQSTLNIVQYFSYHVKVTTTYQTEAQMEFPSITFSPMSIAKRSAVGAYRPIYLMLAIWYSETNQDLPVLMNQYGRTCYSNNSNELTKLLQKEGVDFNTIGQTMGFTNLLKHFVLNFGTMLLKCSWQDKEFNCSNAFMQHISDTYRSFTFNVGNQLLFMQTDANNSQTAASGYGLDIEQYDETNYKVAAPNQGLKLLINVHQNESCANDKVKQGAGIVFQIHDPNTLSQSFFDIDHYLSPGYHFDVAIRRIRYQRNTEHLGHCSSTNDLYLFPYAKGKNVQKLCFLQCLAEIALKKCQCYGQMFIVFEKIFRQQAKRYNLTPDKIRICMTVTDALCIVSVKNAMFNQSIENLCPMCKKQCVEGKFEIGITNSFLSKNTVDKISNGNVSEEEIRKNYLSAHFYFSTMNVLFIEESQEFILRDMFIYIGGNIGLFLGMSFVSPFELLDIFLHLLHGVWKRLRSVEPKDKWRNRHRKKKVLKLKSKIQNIPMTNIKTAVVHPATLENISESNIKVSKNEIEM